MINQLIREDNPLVSKEVIPYYRDLYDHVMQVIDTIDSYRELLASLADVHLSTISNRMNSVMKTLTIFSAIFMPLTFIVGVYGMNFRKHAGTQNKIWLLLRLGCDGVRDIGDGPLFQAEKMAVS